MPAQVTNYQCPNCTGPLRFTEASGKLECEHCGSSFTLAEVEAFMAQKEQAAAEAFAKEQEKKEQEKQQQAAETAEMGGTGGDTWDTSSLNGEWGAEGAGLTAYNCPSCGAELVCDETTAATSCPYCGNPAVVPGQFSGTLKPDFVIPFKLDKKAAVENLKKHYKGRPFLPKTFSNENHVQEIQGVYVPFWLFDGTAQADADFECTRSSKHREGDYEVTRTQHFRVHRSGDATFKRVPVDASSKMPDDYMDSIEPFDYGDLMTFSTAYMPGFLANRYDVSVDECAARADERCANSAVDMLEETIHGYDSCVRLGQNVHLNRGKVHYAMLPVWLLNTKWNGKDFLFAMNGQTGRMVGDLPVSWGKFWRTFALIAVPIAAFMAWFLTW